jgi:hypothetical protein
MSVDQDQELNQPEDWNQPDESFAELEQELKLALRHVDAPAGFAERTMARVQPAGAPRGKLLTMPARLRVWSGSAIAAALVVGVFAGQQVHERRERQKAELAQQQFETAMRITDQTLDQVRLQLAQAGVPVGN